jgi:hypothetical protein
MVLQFLRRKTREKSSLETEAISNYLHFLEMPLKIVGCWDWFMSPTKEYQIILNSVYYSLVLFVLINVPVSLYIHLRTEWEDAMTSLAKMADSMPFIVSIVIVIYFGFYRDELYDLVAYMKVNFKYRSANGLTNMTMLKSYKTAKSFGYFYTGCTLFSVTMYVIPEIVNCKYYWLL